MAFGIDDALAVGLKLIDKWFPSEEEKNKAKVALLEMQQAGEFKALEADVTIAKGQLDTNIEEAKSSDPFVSRWRPFIGWTCGASFAANFVVFPCIQVVSAIVGHQVTLPQLEMAEMLPVLLGMLGLGGFRTYEKVRGASK